MKLLTPEAIIHTVGILGIVAIIFAETGLFIGFFLPGDTLLFAAGIFAARGYFSISLLIVGAVFAAILGDSIAYILGKRVGRKLFEKQDSLYFTQKRLHDAERFYERHGALAIILARFIPFIRMLAPTLAGVAEMKYKKFFLYNIAGAILWSVSVPLLGYYFGSLIPNVDKFLLPILVLVIFLSFVPFAIKFVEHVIKKR